MGILTLFNDKIGKMLEPGWLYSSVNMDRLVLRLTETIDKNVQKSQDGISVAPDRYEIYVNSEVYQKTGNEGQIKAIEEKLLEKALRHITVNEYGVFSREIAVTLKSDFLLPKKDIIFRSFLSEGSKPLFLARRKLFCLVMQKGPEPGRRWILDPGKIYVIGRENADICVSEKTVSGRHASIQVEAEARWLLTDEGSLNGTFIGSADHPVSGTGILHTGDYFQLCTENPVVFILEEQEDE